MRHKMFTVLIMELCDSSDDIDIAALIDADGSVLAGAGLSGLDEDQFGAMVSTQECADLHGSLRESASR